MPRPSKIDRLPAELRELIGRLRSDGRTIDEILGKLRELDVDVARSTLGRHIQGLDAIAEEIKRSRGIAEAMVERFGDAPESRTARLNVELMHAQLMRLLVPEDGTTVKLEPQDAYFLATSIQRLATAAKDDSARLLKEREAAKKEAAKEAAAKLDSALDQARLAGEKGLSTERIAQLRRDFLGVKPEPVIEGKAKEVT